MAMSTFVQGSTVCLEVNFRESSGGPFVDPGDARFDVIDPDGIVRVSDQSTEIVVSPGKHRGCYETPFDATVGVWTMRFQATILDLQVQDDCEFEVVEEPLIEKPGGLCLPWPLDSSCCDFPEEASAELINRQRWVASELLWAASGRIYGPCPVTVRPCLRRCSDSWLTLGTGAGLFVPYLDRSGVWRNASTCGCGDGCSCNELCEVVLEGPVSEVVEVRIGGEAVTDWRLDQVGGSFRIVRTGGGCFPECQDLSADCGEEGAFCVTYLRGLSVSPGGVQAVSELACELVKACIPGCDCRLPRNVVSKTRQGISISFDTEQTWIRSLPSVAIWLDSVNPNKLMRPLRVASPDHRGDRIVR